MRDQQLGALASYVLSGVLLATAIVGISHVVHATPSPVVGSKGILSLTPRIEAGVRLPHPQSSPYVYVQQGATLALLNGNPNVGLTAVYVQVRVPASPYATAYELNGLSNSGDWYQLAIGDNWPGCYGFSAVWEVWNSSGDPVSLACLDLFAPLTIQAGDLARLGLNFSGGRVCMDWTDINLEVGHSICYVQPDAGGTAFVTLASPASPLGFFTGPMTEMVNPLVSSCQRYDSFPTVNYDFVRGVFFSSAWVWANEFVLGGSPCFNTTTLLQQPPGDSGQMFIDTSPVAASSSQSGTVFGPYWDSASNLSSNPVSAISWQFSTDDPPVTVAASEGAADVGQSLALSATTAIGQPPVTYEFFASSQLLGVSSGLLDWTPTAPGTYTVQVIAYNSSGDEIAPSQNLSLTVSPALSAPSINSSRPSGQLDQGQSIALWLNVTGGSGGGAVQWSGLPSWGCLMIQSEAICSAPPVGVYLVSATATDSNGATATAPVYLLVVNPPPHVDLYTDRSNLVEGSQVTFTALDSGGSSPMNLSWTGLPSSCVVSSVVDPMVEQCWFNTSGTVNVSVTVVDSTGAAASSSVKESISPMPAAPFDILPWIALTGVFVGLAAGFVLGWVRRRPSEEAPRNVGASPSRIAGFAPTHHQAEEPEPASTETSPEIVAPYWNVPSPEASDCTRCGNRNPPGSLYCGRCAVPLDGSEPAGR